MQVIQERLNDLDHASNAFTSPMQAVDLIGVPDQSNFEHRGGLAGVGGTSDNIMLFPATKLKTSRFVESAGWRAAGKA